MQECLGIDLNDKIIKYAKVQKDNDTFKLGSYGIRFYDSLELEQTIEQIISETNSQKTPISINIDNERYYYFDFFNMTNKSYAQKAIETEFESFCVDNHINRNAQEGRYIYSVNTMNPDKNKVIYIYESKGDLNERTKFFKGYNLVSATPITTTLPNIAKLEKNKNIMIVDLNEKTTITTVLDRRIYNVDTLEEGLGTAIEQIYQKENSCLKAYEVCKNTTIYTMEMQQNATNEENNEYLQILIPSLYKIAQQVSDTMKNYKRIDQIYLTGLGTAINNTDLYFQEFIKDAKVEILKPFFAEGNTSINIKDYIEVNSAIALAIQGLGFGFKTLNFCKSGSVFENLKKILTSDVSLKGNKGGKKATTEDNGAKKGLGKLNISMPNIQLGKWGTKVAGTLFMDTAVILFVIIAYIIGSTILGNQISGKISQTQEVISDTTKQIDLAEQTDSKIKQKTSDYNKYTTNLENINQAIETKRSRKNQIPNLLNKIIYNIPKEVQLTEIKNTERTEKGNTIQHILIYAQSTKYEQLAYFKAKLKNAGILDNIVSTEGTKEENVVKTVIEGDLKAY